MSNRNPLFRKRATLARVTMVTDRGTIEDGGEHYLLDSVHRSIISMKFANMLATE